MPNHSVAAGIGPLAVTNKFADLCCVPDKVESTSEHFSDPIRRQLGATVEKVLDLPTVECRGVFHEILADVLYRGFSASDSKLIVELGSLGYDGIYNEKMTMLHYLFAGRISGDHQDRRSRAGS